MSNRHAEIMETMLKLGLSHQKARKIADDQIKFDALPIDDAIKEFRRSWGIDAALKE